MANQVEQRVRLDGKQYTQELRRIQSESTSAMGTINKNLHLSQRSFGDFQEEVKKRSVALGESLKNLSASFAKNFGKGGALGLAAGGVSFINTQLRQAASTGMDFSKALAQIGARADIPMERLKKLRKELYELGKTGASLESLPGAVSELYGATGSIDKSMAVMGPISKTAAMGDGDASEVARFVVSRLQGEGRDINKDSVTEMLQSVVSAHRSGQFKDMNEAMAAIGSGDASVKKRAGISDKEYAGMLAGSTRVGTDKETGNAAVRGLLKLSTQGFKADSALAGMLGVKGGSFMKDGKFNISSLMSAAAGAKNLRMDEGSKKQLMQETGLSEQEATGLLAILKNIKEFLAGVQKVVGDTKALDQSFGESTDNLSDGLKAMRNQFDQGIDEIFSPMGTVLKKAVKGDLAGAMSDIPNALVGMTKGLADNKGMVLSAAAITAMSGALTGKLLGGGGLGSGVMRGKMMEKAAGITPVFVTNADEIRLGAAAVAETAAAIAAGQAAKSAADTYSASSGGAAGAGGAAAAKSGGIKGGLRGAALGIPAAGAVVAAASIAVQQYRIASESDTSKQKWIAEGGEAGTGNQAANGGNVLMNTLVDWIKKGSTHKVEITSTDGRYNAVPKASDNARNPRGP